MKTSRPTTTLRLAVTSAVLLVAACWQVGGVDGAGMMDAWDGCDVHAGACVAVHSRSTLNLSERP